MPVGGWVQNRFMPELPEVAALVADLRERLVGRTIARVDVLVVSALKTFDPPVTALAGRTITDVTRHGKWLDLATDDGLHLLVHLARAGWLRWRSAAPKPTKPGRGPLAARLVLDDGSGFDLTEAGTAKRLAIHLVHDPDEIDAVRTLGLDPMSDAFTAEAFDRILDAAGRARIKGVLRDQRRIAGIGNAYSDEILHAARMSPYKPADMPAADRERLYAAVRTTLAEAVERASGRPASELKSEKREALRVHGRAGSPCPVCGDTIRHVEFVDSTFEYCPTCQTGGRVLADRVRSRLVK